jgi:hypothetical protein
MEWNVSMKATRSEPVPCSNGRPGCRAPHRSRMLAGRGPAAREDRAQLGWREGGNLYVLTSTFSSMPNASGISTATE